MSHTEPHTVLDLLAQHSDADPDAIACRFLTDGRADGRSEVWSFAELWRQINGISSLLREHKLVHQRVLLLYASGLPFVAGFLGCLHAGAIAVPAYPPDPSRLDRTLPRLRGIAADAGVRAVLTTKEIAAFAGALAGSAPDLASLPWLATDASITREVVAAKARLEDVAFLQYTSGSTAAPKGVVVTHANLMRHIALATEAFEHRGSCPFVSWLPLFHDMGLIGNLLQPLAHGSMTTLMAPEAFLRRPVEWLRAITRFDCDTTGAPNFAYALCNRRITDEELEGLDLSGLRVAYCGAEPIQAEVLRRFAERFAAVGFRPEMLVPCYGLAEATLMVTCAPVGVGVQTDVDGRVVLGGTFGGQELRIVDPKTREHLPDGQVGEIWVRGGAVARGYFGQPELSAEVFAAVTADGAGPFLRTGDLGSVREGALSIVGRLGDRIIVRGRNLYPEDIEVRLESCHDVLRPGGVIVFSIEADAEAEAEGERIVVVTEAELDDAAAIDALAAAVRACLIEGFDLPLHTLVLLPRRSLPKTSSGKRQRRAARAAFLAKTLPERQRIVGDAKIEPARPSVDRSPAPSDRPHMETWLRERVAAVLERPPERVPLDASFASLGLDSARAVELAAALDDLLDRPFHASILYNVPTVERLAAWLVEGGPAAVRTAAVTEELYPELDRALERLERREPERYRFDLEADIPWSRTAEPGEYIPPALWSAFGIDPAPLQAHPQAWQLLQQATALATCTAFEVVEITITLFIDTEWPTLGQTRSIEAFREEELKHVRLFRRYANVLSERHPELASQLTWDPAWGVGYWELFRRPELFPSPRVFHYLFWFFFISFEEHSIYIADSLAAAEGIQPAWASAHAAHRREELQHVATDYAYVGALDLPDDERDAWSEVCAAWLCQHFDTFFAYGSARRLVAERFPELAPALRTRGFVRSPFFEHLLQARSFRRTRLTCPYLRDLQGLQPEERPSDAELAARLPGAWFEDRPRALPDPLVRP